MNRPFSALKKALATLILACAAAGSAAASSRAAGWTDAFPDEGGFVSSH